MIDPTMRSTTRRSKMAAGMPRAAAFLALGVCAALLAPLAADAAQIPMTGSLASSDTGIRRTAGTVEPATTTLVDLLSADGELSLFIRLLQHARLIPTLNKLQNATLFAPTNDAVNSEPWMLDLLSEESNISWNVERDDSDPHDNLNYRLRERLFYHMLNYSWTPPEPASQDEQGKDGYISPIAAYETTLLFPTKHEDHGRPGHVPYPEPQDTLLGGEGQKLAVAIQGRTSSRRLGAQQNDQAAPVLRVGVDELGAGGAAIIPSRGGTARNGKLVVIDSTLRPPKSLAHQIKSRAREASNTVQGEGKAEGKPYDGPSLSRLASLLTDDLWNNLTEGQHLTLFAPRDEAFDALHELEWKYLISGFATDDILQIAMNHESAFDGGHRQKVGYMDRLLARKEGDSVTVVTGEAGQATVNGSSVLTPNVLASNGVMHVVDRLLLPYGSLALTPEKYLLALNATRFVSLFRAAELSYLLQSSPHNPGNNASYTILATRDDILERYESQPWQTLPPAGSKEMKETLQYHILEGTWTKKQLKDGALLKTMLQSEELGGAHQRIPVSVTSKKAAEGDIGFGSASVISEPIEAGGSIIYLVSKILEPPASLVSTALDKGLSTFVASVYASELDKKLTKAPATTFLAPTNSAFEYLGLAMNYLLLPSASHELSRLIQYHAVKGIVYLEDVSYDTMHYPTLEGSDIFIERSKKLSHLRVRGPRIGGFPANGDTRDARISEGDLLTSTGVMHVMDQVELPPTLNITSDKLMRGAKASTFLDLLKQVNMSWVAEGQSAPDEFWQSSPFIDLTKRDKDRIRKRFFQRESYTLLVPTDKAFTRINLTSYLNNAPYLTALVQQHIIPSPPPSKGSLSDPTAFPSDGKPLVLEDDRSFPSLLSRSEGGTSKYGDLAFRKAGESDWLVGIKNARGTDGKHDAARILGFGRNTPRFTDGHDTGRGQGDEHYRDEGDMSSHSMVRRSAKMSFGGGILLIDAVLEPYEPGWFQRWGWIAMIVLLGVAGASSIGLLGWKLWERRKQQNAHYEALRQEGEED